MTFFSGGMQTDAETEIRDYPTAFGVTLTPQIQGVLAAVLGLIVAGYAASSFVLPEFQRFQELNENVATKQTDLQQKTETVRRIDQIKASLLRAQEQNAEVRALLPSQKSLDTLLLDLNRLITQSNAQLVTFTPDYGASGPVVDGSLGPELNAKLKRQVTTVAFDGSFNQTLNIMRSLDRLQTLLVIRDLSINLPPNQQGQPGPSRNALRSSFKLYAYVPLTPEEAAAAQQQAQNPPPK